MSGIGRGPTVIAGLANDSTPIAGNTFWVDSGAGSNGYEGSRADPFATLDYAVGKCTANNGDFIFIKPGHTESISSAGALDLDVAGITIVGLGNGSDRPTFTLDTATTADIDVDAANITVKNCIFECDIDALAAGIDVNAANFTMDGCDFNDLTTKNSLIWIAGVAAASDMTIINCTNKGTATAGNTCWISLAAQDHCVIKNCVSEGDFSLANIDCTAAPTDLLIEGCRLENANAVDVNIEGFAAATGWVVGNMCRLATSGQTTWINTPGALGVYENYGVDDDGTRAVIFGTAT